jgi:hypothetical protein
MSTPAATPTATVTPTPTRTAAPETTTPNVTPPPETPADTNPLEDLFGGDETDIVVNGGSLPVDPTLVYDRTGRLLATDVPGPTSVQLLDATANTTRPPEFQRLLGLESNVSEVEAAAFVVGPGTVYVNRNITDRPAFTEHVLAHEFTHTVQFRQGYIGRVQAATSPDPDGRFASTAVIEGGATYAQDRYWLTYMANRTVPGERPARDVAGDYRNATGATKYAFAPYWLGYRYANATLDSPADLPDLYADPPRTAEQVLHPGVEESPAPLRVALRGERTGTWQETFAPQRGRMGEAFLRVTLDTELAPRRATAAAAGWGNDTRIAFNNESGARGYAWVVRFDDAANATAFEAAVRDYLDGRARSTATDAAGAAWRTRLDDRTARYRFVPVDDRTAVLLLGVPAFVGTTTVESTDGGALLTVD